MSLRAWYPFNGNANNQGTGNLNLIQTVAPAYVSGGKLCNKALATGAFKWSATQAASIFNNQAISIAFWIKPLVGEKDSICLFGQPGMTPPNNRKFTIYAHPSTNDLHLSWQNDGSDAIISPVYLGVFPTNKWTHCCITYDNPTGIVYINGKQHATFTMTSDSSSFANETPVINNSSKRLMQDLRVYDHCLTPREVRHIAQGLAWHWKLDSIANPNFVSDIVARKNVVKLNNYSLNLDLAPRNDSYFNIKVTPALEINKTYTLSFDVSNYPEQAGGYGLYMFNQGNSNYYFVIYRNGHYKFTFTTDEAKLPSGYNLSEFIIDDGGHPNSDAVIKLSNFKIELGPDATKWCPNINDKKLYHIFSANGATEYDCSGYGYHGYRSGSLRGSNDTPRYEQSTELTYGDYLRADDMDTNGWSDLTLSAWVNPSTYTATGTDTGRQTIIIGGAYLTLSNGYVSSYCYGKTSSYFTDSTTKVPLNEWSHIAAVWCADGTHKLYVNGKAVASTTLSTADASGELHGWKEVGAETYGASRKFQGKISDVRIYATALSDEDMKELYQTAATYHENGIYASHELMNDSVANIKIHQNKTSAEDFSEVGYIGGMKTKVLPDGSAWARIHWLDITTDQTVFANDAEVAFCDKPNRFSRMGLVEHFKSYSIPKGYTQLEYIDSTGTQYIDTGYYWQSETARIVFDGAVTSNNSNQSLFGNEEPFTGGDRYFSIIPHGKNGNFSFYVGSSGGIMSGSLALNTRFVMECSTSTDKKFTLKLQGTTVGTTTYSGTIMSYANTSSTHSSKGRIYIFANHNSSSGAAATQHIGGMRLYNFKMYDNNKITRDFIPVKRDSDGTIGLLDKVYNIFYPNSGSGTFVAGPVVADQASTTGVYEFMLTYPSLSETEYNRWTQVNSPNAAYGAAEGLKKITTAWNSHSNAITKSNSSGSATYSMNASANWWAPIGQKTLYTGNTIPAANGSSQTETELWVRIDNLSKLNKISMLDEKSIQAFEINEI